MAAKSTGKCAQRAAHRQAQAKYVAKSPSKQRARVAASESKKSQAQKKTVAQKKAQHAGKGNGKTGRPRKSC